MTDHNIDLGYNPRKWQRDAHIGMGAKRFAIACCHRRAGKTVMAKMELIDRALRKPRFEGSYIAQTLGQSRRNMWGQLKDSAEKIPGTIVRETEMLIQFPNKSTIRCLGADAVEGIRGLGFDYVVADEFSLWDQDALPQVVLPTLAGREGGLLLIGTPSGIDPLSIEYQRRRDDPTWYAVKFSVYDTGVLTPEEIETQKSMMNPNLFALEFECDFTRGSHNSLISAEEVEQAFKRQGPALHEIRSHPVVIGVDVARYGDDRTVIYVRQGPRVHAPIVMRKANTIEIAAKVAELHGQHNADAVFIDYSAGLGGGVEDQLSAFKVYPICVHFNGKPQNDRFLNLRAEMWFKMTQAFRTGLCVEKDEDLLSELTVATFINEDKLKLRSKADMKADGMKSPDKADALALTWAYPVPMRAAKTGFQQQYKTPDWDVYAD